jgi:hypothetical protein
LKHSMHRILVKTEVARIRERIIFKSEYDHKKSRDSLSANAVKSRIKSMNLILKKYFFDFNYNIKC